MDAESNVDPRLINHLPLVEVIIGILRFRPLKRGGLLIIPDSSFHFLFHYPYGIPATLPQYYPYEALKRRVVINHGSTLGSLQSLESLLHASGCSLRVCTLGFGPLNHGNMALNNGIWHPKPRVTNIKGTNLKPLNA